MIAAGIFGKAGWQVYDHLYFLDKEENKGREIDLSAIYSHTESNLKKSLTVKVGLSVEVKKAASKPWVVFTSPLNAPVETIENLFDTSLIRLHIQEIWFKGLYGTRRSHNSSGSDVFHISPSEQHRKLITARNLEQRSGIQKNAALPPIFRHLFHHLRLPLRSQIFSDRETPKTFVLLTIPRSGRTKLV